MPPAATLADALQPLRDDPSRAAILLDIDGTLAPIVRHAEDAHVPESTRTALIAVARQYALVACISGRQAATARSMVAIGTLTYVGAHGVEVLNPGGTQVELDREVAAWQDRVQRFADRHDTDELRRLRIRHEDKQAIRAMHWRGVPDEAAAEAALHDVAADAERSGLAVHWGRKVLEIRPPVEISKGNGIKRLLRAHDDIDVALYVGDDRTDVDGFDGLRELVEQGRLKAAVCVGVMSEETPQELTAAADVLVDGTGGVRGMLEALGA